MPNPSQLLRLISEVKGGKPATAARAKYLHPYSFYAKQYERTVRQIKRYAAEGLPLDNPDAMGEHLTPRGRKTTVDNFAEDPPRVPLVDDAAPDMDEHRTTILDESFLRGEGLVPAMQRISRMELALAEKLAQEINKPGFNFREFSNRFGIWIGMLKTMGKIEKDAPGILEKHKKQIDIGEVEEGVTKLLLAIVARLEMLPTRAMQTLAGFTKPADIREELEAEIADVLAPIRDCEWMPAEIRAGLVQQIVSAPAATPEDAQE